MKTKCDSFLTEKMSGPDKIHRCKLMSTFNELCLSCTFPTSNFKLMYTASQYWLADFNSGMVKSNKLLTVYNLYFFIIKRETMQSHVPSLTSLRLHTMAFGSSSARSARKIH